MPVVGFLSSASRDQDAGRLRAFHEGLAETGYVEGRNVAVEDRWADEQNERLPQLAADLVNRRVDVIATSGHVLAVFAGPWQRRAIEQAARQLEVKLQVIEMRPESLTGLRGRLGLSAYKGWSSCHRRSSHDTQPDGQRSPAQPAFPRYRCFQSSPMPEELLAYGPIPFGSRACGPQ